MELLSIDALSLEPEPQMTIADIEESLRKKRIELKMTWEPRNRFALENRIKRLKAMLRESKDNESALSAQEPLAPTG